MKLLFLILFLSVCVPSQALQYPQTEILTFSQWKEKDQYHQFKAVLRYKLILDVKYDTVIDIDDWTMSYIHQELEKRNAKNFYTSFEQLLKDTNKIK